MSWYSRSIDWDRIHESVKSPYLPTSGTVLPNLCCLTKERVNNDPFNEDYETMCSCVKHKPRYFWTSLYWNVDVLFCLTWPSSVRPETVEGSLRSCPECSRSWPLDIFAHLFFWHHHWDLYFSPTSMDRLPSWWWSWNRWRSESDWRWRTKRKRWVEATMPIATSTMRKKQNIELGRTARDNRI